MMTRQPWAVPHVRTLSVSLDTANSSGSTTDGVSSTGASPDALVAGTKSS